MSASTLYTAMSGLEAASYRQALQANNLANVNTVGFRAQIGTLRSAPVFGPAADTGQADVVTEDAGFSSAQGALTRTNSPWNIALSGQGWLVTRSAGGRIVLTRDGQLHRGPGGLLRDSAGDLVLGANQNPISLPALKHMEIGVDGTISGVPTGQGTQQAQQFNRLFIAQTPAGHLSRIGDSRFEVPVGAAALQRANQVQVKQGYLEGSNVNAITAMVQLISDTRSFQIASRLVHNTQSASQGLDALISQG